MKAKKAVVAVVGVLLVGNVVCAQSTDFILEGTEHLNVTTLRGTGVLWDFSTATVLTGGDIGTAYVNDEASLSLNSGGVGMAWVYNAGHINLTGSTVRGSILAYNASTVDIAGGKVTQRVSAYDTSAVDIFGGSTLSLDTYDDSSAVLSTGSVGNLLAFGTSNVEISGGDVSFVNAYDTSAVDISGGVVSGLSARDTGSITLHGYDFRATGGIVLDGTRVMGTGLLSGKWFDGTAWAAPVYTNEAGASIFIPEPATLSLLALGGLALLRRRIARRV